jgi:hypothetical protein
MGYLCHWGESGVNSKPVKNGGRFDGLEHVFSCEGGDVCIFGSLLKNLNQNKGLFQFFMKR